ncbi:MAG: hypothetical protein WC829_06885 [Hyphomicrobium sp.]|jgi:hypothetical protein
MSGERVVAAAILFDGIICVLPPPARHHTILHAIHALVPDRIIGPKEQGFVTDTGRFVGREEAAVIAVRAEQIEVPQYGRDLFSEDLW